MSDVLHHARLTPTQQGAIGRRMRFLADLKARAFVPPPEPTPIPARVLNFRTISDVAFGPILSGDDIAFGPVVLERFAPTYSIAEIVKETARYFEIPKLDLMSARRTANIVRPRQIAMYMARNVTRRSLPEIGRRMGGRDHTTILHGVRKIKGLIEAGDSEVVKAVVHLKALFPVEE